MSKIKYLLRKLHIGNGHNNRPSRRRSPSSNPSTESSTPPSSSSPVSSPPSDSSDRTVRELPSGNVRVRNPRDFNFVEEEFQVQLAMALSASDPRKDDEADQIKAAKQLSLGCSPSVADNEAISEFLSLKYWNYNVVQYEEKVVDGFYDVHTITSNLIAQGDMPLLVDLQAISILENGPLEVVLVNRSIDIQLKQLEDRVYTISVECRVMGNELFLNSLIQRIAHLVVDRLGGPVVDAKEMMKRWRIRSNQLKSSLNTIVLPLGSLDVGLSRHRALLFKVLADRVNLPCMLVKGSLYTGTDEGAVNLIRFDDGSEYILDLMAAPGTLIPVEVPSNLLLDTALEGRVLSENTAAVHNLSLIFDEMVGLDGSIHDVPEVCESNLKEIAIDRTPGKQENEVYVVDDLTQRYQFEKPVTSEFRLFYGSGGPVEEASLRQENKVKDVSKYVISAAKNPEFAQKLHAVLLESGASPPADLFMDIHPVSVGGKVLANQILPLGQQFLDSRFSDPENCRPDELSLQSFSVVQALYNNEIVYSVENSLAQQLQLGTNLVHSSLNSELKDDGVNHVAVEANKIVIRDGLTAKLSGGMPDHDGHIFQDSRGEVINQTEIGDLSARKLMETAKSGCLISCCDYGDNFTLVSGEKVCPMLGEFAEWEIPWEDLQIGERIGIGSFGEVFRADWNGTEVAVKKFLVQDLTGDVLVQFKCEAEMMIRLRHPNVVLFMGAVSCPPNLSILTEFLPRGSLYKLLHRSGTQIDEKTRMKMALDVARGMNYLHTSHPTVVHRDLKSPNLLVDKNWVVKVCDFGLSRVKHHTFLSSNSTAGTPEWMAPEVLRNEPSDEKCDVYSFGVILWELITLCVPWTGWNPMQVVGAVGFQNRRLEIPIEVDPVVAQIIRDCWENDPRMRPSFAQLISRLKGLHCLVVQRD